MDNHNCYCPTCAWAVFRHGPVGGKNHYRAGDHFVKAISAVQVNGQDVMADCFEVLAGDDGWAYVYTKLPDEQGRVRRHLCETCKSGMCARVLTGRVEITWDMAKLRCLEQQLDSRYRTGLMRRPLLIGGDPFPE